MLVVVLVLENPDRFAIRLTEQISCRTSVSLRSRNPTEDEHDDEDEDDSKFPFLGSIRPFADEIGHDFVADTKSGFQARQITG